MVSGLGYDTFQMRMLLSPPADARRQMSSVRCWKVTEYTGWLSSCQWMAMVEAFMCWKCVQDTCLEDQCVGGW